MNGGLFKTTSRTALAAVAASFAATSAMAADLGGNCCADLEERIADLEATTVRKGNRKVSLTLSGQVHESILFWDDGFERNVYYGVNNINSSSRFRMVGQAKIDAEWSAGYLIEIETEGKSDSNDVNQTTNVAGGTSVTTRHNAWWIDNKRLGRIWLGLTDVATAGIEAINLANTAYVANHKMGLLASSFQLRTTAGGNGGTIGSLTGGNNGLVGLGNVTRQNTLKYVSPTIAGFVMSAAVADDDFWDVSLKYANEFNGVRVAFGIGYAKQTDGTSGLNSGCQQIGGNNRECESFTLGGSMMHVPTGLYVKAGYGRRTDDLRVVAVGGTDEDIAWDIQGGVERNFIGIGKTTFYGEFLHYDGGAANLPAGTVASEVEVWGLGVVQAIDAAAMDLYVGFRSYSGETTLAGGAAGPSLEDFQVINAGGVIRF